MWRLVILCCLRRSRRRKTAVENPCPKSGTWGTRVVGVRRMGWLSAAGYELPATGAKVPIRWGAALG